MTAKEINSHTDQVRLFFEEPIRYLGRRAFDIRIRFETVQEFIQKKTFGHILDIGCGDGSISLPLLTHYQCQQLTLLDMSSSMLSLAKKKITEDISGRVKFINENFIDTELDPQGYDLILCLGVLAHVDSPAEVIARIARFLKPGGILILEVTDSYHPIGAILGLYHRMLDYLVVNKHKLNWLRTKDIILTCQEHNLSPSAFYRYSLPPPGSHRIFSQENMYKMTRIVFGFSLDKNRNKWLGNVSIYCFDKQPVNQQQQN
ncbi:class I SAM-dependent methyltransferase [Methylomicrobium lacus]|uniref:class I SAM-dependent methyltransferase n=1 Tax=Methylomicrobium lacus TaxID=136992 RepID=UPI0035A8FBA9